MRINDLSVTVVPLPKPGPGQVRIRLRTASLNHRDLLILEGTWQGWGKHTLGSDGAGIIDALGDGVQGIDLGEEVVINPALYWGNDQHAPAATFQPLGGPTDGCFAEAVIVPAENVFKRPSFLTWEETAAIPTASLPAYRGLVLRAGLKSTDTILIHGIGGGVAQAGLMICW